MGKLFFGSIFIGFVVGAVYAAAQFFSPSMLLELIVLLVAIGFIGSGVWRLAWWARVSSQMAIGVAGLLAGLAAIYSSWGTSFALHAGEFSWNYYSPLAILIFALFLFEESAFTIETETGEIVIEGFSQVLLWLGEILALCGGVIYWVTKKRNLQGPYCERCRNWCETEKGFVRIEASETENFVASTERSDFQWLHEAPFASIDEDPHLRIDLAGCKSCTGQRTVSLWLVRYVGETQLLIADVKVPEQIDGKLETCRTDYLEFCEEDEPDDDELKEGEFDEE